jgi:signal transduction histidine kinase
VIRTVIEHIAPTIGKKVAAAVICVLFVAGGLFVYFAKQSGTAILGQEMDTKARGVGNLVTAIINDVMSEGHHERLREAVQNAVTSRDILSLRIIRNDGSVAMEAVAHGDSAGFPLARFGPLDRITGEKTLSDDSRGTYLQYSIRPIPKKAVCAGCHTATEQYRGFLAMTISMDDVRAAAIGHRDTNIVMSVLTFLGLGVSIILALSLIVIVPIRRLHTHIRTIQESIRQTDERQTLALPVLVEPRGNDEVAQLSRDFNNLILRLNDANEKIAELHRKDLERADRLASTGQMAASIAHEIKNPIAGILGAVQVFESETPENDPRREIFAEMKVQLERVNHAVNDLLSYARPTPPMFEEISISEIVQKTVTLLSQQARGKPIRLETKLPPAPVAIMADRKQIQQVIWNIILNGIQAIETAGSVTVTVTHEPSSVAISITDTGKGIPSDKIESIFVPFYSTKHKGTGLGMTICRNIAEQHHGSIQVVSQQGAGTTVTIHLPSTQTQPG